MTHGDMCLYLRQNAVGQPEVNGLHVRAKVSVQQLHLLCIAGIQFAGLVQDPGVICKAEDKMVRALMLCNISLG
eukprot:1141567-Pelagomonas_calceolata.AAC.1